MDVIIGFVSTLARLFGPRVLDCNDEHNTRSAESSSTGRGTAFRNTHPIR
jgi:hypothetical protein